MSADDKLLEVVRALARADLDELRAVWRKYVGAVPKLRSADLLRWVLAYRLQAQAYGGLGEGQRRLLRRGEAGTGNGPRLRPGVRLTREWRGRLYEVEVLSDGFVHDAQQFASLSQVATHITGTRWNGPRFFGLRRAEGL